MKTADEMFEDLGYHYTGKHYEKDDEMGWITISFSPCNKTWICTVWLDETGASANKNMTAKETGAIHKKLEELGWV